MATVTMVVDGVQFEVDQADDGYYNLTKFFKANSTLRPASLEKDRVKEWIKAQRNPGFRQGDTNRTWMVRQDLMVSWIRQGLQAKVVGDEETTNFDTREDSNFSKKFNQLLDAIASGAKQTRDYVKESAETVINTVDAKFKGVHEWLTKVDAKMETKADKSEVDDLRDQIRKMKDELRRHEEMLRNRGN